jgi:hypothetical protein
VEFSGLERRSKSRNRPSAASLLTFKLTRDLAGSVAARNISISFALVGRKTIDDLIELIEQSAWAAVMLFRAGVLMEVKDRSRISLVVSFHTCVEQESDPTPQIKILLLLLCFLWQCPSNHFSTTFALHPSQNLAGVPSPLRGRFLWHESTLWRRGAPSIRRFLWAYRAVMTLERAPWTRADC